MLSVALVSMLALYGWSTIREPGFEPGSSTGYRLGLIGALMMLALFVYPLRKHVPWLREFGKLSDWLQLHMILGVCGPVLILFHSRFHIGSLNAAVAMASMTVVALSGFVGRFIYGRIHSRLNGRKLEAAELRNAVNAILAEVERGGALPASVRDLLAGFEAAAARQPTTLAGHALRFLSVAHRRRRTFGAIRRELRRAPADARRRARIEHGLGLYLRGLQRVAQFSVYERLFAAWHVLHIPLVALLFVSAVFHVIAVHMY
jgi:hypothetical protein